MKTLQAGLERVRAACVISSVTLMCLVAAQSSWAAPVDATSALSDASPEGGDDSGVEPYSTLPIAPVVTRYLVWNEGLVRESVTQWAIPWENSPTDANGVPTHDQFRVWFENYLVLENPPTNPGPATLVAEFRMAEPYRRCPPNQNACDPTDPRNCFPINSSALFAVETYLYQTGQPFHFGDGGNENFGIRVQFFEHPNDLKTLRCEDLEESQEMRVCRDMDAGFPVNFQIIQPPTSAVHTVRQTQDLPHPELGQKWYVEIMPMQGNANPAQPLTDSHGLGVWGAAGPP